MSATGVKIRKNLGYFKKNNIFDFKVGVGNKVYEPIMRFDISNTNYAKFEVPYTWASSIQKPEDMSNCLLIPYDSISLTVLPKYSSEDGRVLFTSDTTLDLDPASVANNSTIAATIKSILTKLLPLGNTRFNEFKIILHSLIIDNIMDMSISDANFLVLIAAWYNHKKASHEIAKFSIPYESVLGVALKYSLYGDLSKNFNRTKYKLTCYNRL